MIQNSIPKNIRNTIENTSNFFIRSNSLLIIHIYSGEDSSEVLSFGISVVEFFSCN